MNISIKATHVDLTPSVKEYVEEKVGSLAKFIDIMEAKVELKRDQHHQTGLVFGSDITLIIGGKTMHAESEAEDIYAAIDLLVPKIKDQIEKFKDKKTSLWRRAARLFKGKM
ncbi:MAG: ribosomal subunit interface protein [Candidatus Doudnabacteria bacterium RIFCSPLOWO2_02_FULL_49_13]|uniref:Ribosomal subunit interface protein n=1 Tax=Candidatus Doudnabacteria bacterium RIFCSPHIGHO2_12_FULL_48_16 TaxID=1817838 RepID=A0A1F5PIM9_9BACT|nr:MAG: ribosomal subunit interface protein [Candidatus Doudnabacteria bacterium RIFCSPHIGHO2_02_FULL_49_24]OGE89553.1 MAG: ribosomal subunit interface protein [Candidatus Doudnabacteria bacterium RIFCSPHIGHO2_01_FULL_50_67]OGE89803.1 MAG: ribosomal subunit interface protein [Candidatus Doudnabacteria bacterium RIFCSPHIGHO2_12_FULL_48_16]OGE97708.1 MAG: ribosomal subunit interface protein [Candidatus Doudnabacteria bacterium RIFCSPLOWO2_01_FULL_49_40]OGF02807.1 MAG: ribosomal subunit interface 